MKVAAAEGYALWAEHWQDTPSPVVAVEERVLAPWIERIRARRAVDVGCGTGRWTARLSAVGVDASSAMLAIAARKTELRGRLALADAASLPIATACADLVLCTLVLGHIREHAAALRELARILEPGGTLILTDFHHDAVARGWQRTFRHEGHVYELENYPYAITNIPGLVIEERIDASIEEPERVIFDRAGRRELFEAACETPVVLATRWTRL